MKHQSEISQELAAIARLPQFAELLRQQQADKLAAEERDRCACLDEIASLDDEKKKFDQQLERAKKVMQDAAEAMEKRRGELAMAERACNEIDRRWQNASQRLLKEHGEGHLSSALLLMHSVIEGQRRVVASFDGQIYQRTPWGTMREDAKKKAEHTTAFQRLADLHAIDDQLRALTGKRCASTQLVLEVDALLERAGLARRDDPVGEDVAA